MEDVYTPIDEAINVKAERIDFAAWRTDLDTVEQTVGLIGNDIDSLSDQVRDLQTDSALYTIPPLSDVSTSPRFDKIIGALAKAQGEIENATKDSKNPHFQSKYADLASGFNAIRKAFSDNGIAYTQTIKASAVANELTLYTRLWHGDQWLQTEWPGMKMGGTPQQRGSDLTYAKRYSLFAIAGLAGEDDDGNEASNRAPARQEAPQAAPRGRQTVSSGKREEGPREPSLTDDASATLLAALLATLTVCESREAIVKWSAANSNEKGKLTALDQGLLKKAFGDQQATVKAAATPPAEAAPAPEEKLAA